MRIHRRIDFTAYPLAAQWAVLAALSLLLVAAATAFRLPAAMMIGPLLAAIFVAVSGGRIRMPMSPFIAAQGLVGAMIGASIPLNAFANLGHDWPLITFGILGVIVAAGVIGYTLTRWSILPGTTAIWGVSPGASTPMILMSEAYGADPRLVAVMQKLRVTCVIAVAAIVARIWTPAAVTAPGTAAAASAWFPPLLWGPFAATLVTAIGGAFLATVLRIPAGAMLVPLTLAMLLHWLQWLDTSLPPWLLASSYATIGWTIGLSFTRAILTHAVHAMPRILASILALIGLSGIIAWVLVMAGGIDPMTAYLATSPGGADSIAIIAATTPGIDMRFIVTLQTMRLVVVMLVSPLISRAIARRAMADGARSPGLGKL